MTVTMDEMNSKIEASEARTDAMSQGVLREVQEMRSEVQGIRAEVQLTTLHQRGWFMIMAVSIVLSTVTIQAFLGSRSTPQAPIIVTQTSN
ncbi:MAG: hypothetical protein P8P44_08240 [Alphaproteobacteria bacterium]|nr:hypothetical protein [Alphaproteobacteria bacterium]